MKVSQPQLGGQSEVPRGTLQGFGIPESHALNVLGNVPVVPCDPDSFHDAILFQASCLRHPGILPASAVE